ncbi:MAG: TatD family hydrolase [Methylacidiphilales bacterium]|nr:TatD family hydrolase [Candidatus Methylacidiphilales bacterium]MDW8348690.1 TatD family hydrolase [Verrucomicrobiae bacterium]
MLIDTHAHLDYPDYERDLPQVIERALSAGVTRILTIGTNLQSCHRAIELARAYPQVVFPVIGIHPHHADEWDGSTEKTLRQIIESHPVAAIGETGLDYHRLPSQKISDPSAAHDTDQAYKQRQQDVFRAQLELAVAYGLNVVVHQRDAWEDTLRILHPYTGRLRGVFHCFGGTLEQAMDLLRLGHIVSFTGIVTFKNAQQVQNTAAQVPLDSFMVETDCPYLAPTPFRGKRCEPAHTRVIAETVAMLRSVSLQSIAEQTTATAEKFFRLG